jgi:hypothetical protein
MKTTINDFHDACRELGKDHVYVREYFEIIGLGVQLTPDAEAYLKLRIVVAALNRGWKPSWRGMTYHPWIQHTSELYALQHPDRCCYKVQEADSPQHWVTCGIGFSPDFESCKTLELHTKPMVEHVMRHFFDLYKALYLPNP